MNDTAELLETAPEHVRAAWLSLTTKQKALAIALPTAATNEAAMLAAGYAAKTARSGQHVISNKVQDCARWLAGNAIKQATVDVARLVTELAHTALLDPIDIFDANDCIKPVTQWPEHARRALSSVEVFEEYTKGKEPEYLGRTKKLKFWGKVDAADKLLKVLGGYAPEKVDHTHRIDGLAGLLKEINGADTGPGPARSRR